MAIGIIATLIISDEKAAEFEGVFTELSQQVRANEPGNHLYQLTKSRTEAGTYKILELYTDEAALRHHSSTDYFKSAGGKMRSCFAAPPKVEYLDVVS